MADQAKTVPVEMLTAMASEKNDRVVGAIVYVSEAERDRLFEKGYACEPSTEAVAAESKTKRGRKPAAEKTEE